MSIYLSVCLYVPSQGMFSQYFYIYFNGLTYHVESYPYFCPWRSICQHCGLCSASKHFPLPASRPLQLAVCAPGNKNYLKMIVFSYESVGSGLVQYPSCIFLSILTKNQDNRTKVKKGKLTFVICQIIINSKLAKKIIKHFGTNGNWIPSILI